MLNRARRSVAGLVLAGVFVGLTIAPAPGMAVLAAVEPTGDGSNLLPAGARTLRLDGSGITVATWESGRLAAGAVPRSGFAVQMEPGGPWHRVDDASYILKLRYAEFDPVFTGEPPVPPHLTAGDPEQGRQAYIVQFITQPLEPYREAIRHAGGVIHRFLAHHSYIVHLDAAGLARVQAMPFVRWVGAYHPAYKLEEELLEAMGEDPFGLTATRLYIQVMERGLVDKERVAARVAAIGGQVNAMIPDGFLLEATLDGLQVMDIAAMPEVLWIDRWSPYESDMDIARQIGGGNFVHNTLGYTGQGVRAEVMDGNVLTTHVDFQNPPVLLHGSRSGSASHGTATYGINFGTGTANAQGKGMAPSAQGIFASYASLTNRYQHTAELLQAPYFAVYQSNSWGSTQTTQYTNISTEMDDILFINDIVICQSQSNTGNQNSRPQAWAKNIVSVGGIAHRNTLTKSDDAWTSASIGPAADGRIKPDLAHFYDSIFTTTSTNNTAYTSSFGGTSGATPITAGHFALFFQMWHEGIFGNEVDSNGTVFSNRPHMTTAKAIMINTADPYPFTGPTHNLSRAKQGWGMADLSRLHNVRNKMFIVNEDRVLTLLQTATYELAVEPGTPEFRATMTYADPGGTTSSTLHRINDLSLKVTSPGGTIYWGNNGLADGLWSTSGGSANTRDTVENVFVQNPQQGVWRVEVIASEINQDGHRETQAVDADFALIVTGVVPPSTTATLTSFTIQSGTLLSGGLPELTQSDDQYLRVRSGFGNTFTELHRLNMQINAQAAGSPSTIDVKVEQRLVSQNGTGRLWVRNWPQNRFDLVDSFSIGTTDVVRTITGLPAADYVAGDGSVRIQLRNLVVVPIFAFTFDTEIDHVEVSLN
ncbi:MAG: S8 family serine peptidase [Phycisphaeraceae bacterium]|nr:MAG: S8 family serine peptidase [Phycisphaeraceae bacterium]